MSRIFTAVPGATSISAIQRQALKTSDGLYFYTSDGDLMYVKVSETAILLLNNIYAVDAESRTYIVTRNTFTIDAETRSFSVLSESRNYAV